MAQSTIRRVGNTLMVEIPTELERKLHLVEGSRIELDGTERQVTIHKARKYSLEELLAECDYSLPITEEEREWIDAPAVGRELI